MWRALAVMGRLAAIFALLGVALFFGQMAIGTLANLWADYQDSPTYVYIVVSAWAIACTVAVLAGVVYLIKRF